ncbi:MAG TPA: hypothetical protein PKX21_02455 [Candidatus Pacearchaeota archaeon]|nr:hypothetical protein [Candidatus Pacearchaeota archaeon]
MADRQIENKIIFCCLVLLAVALGVYFLINWPREATFSQQPLI